MTFQGRYARRDVEPRKQRGPRRYNPPCVVLKDRNPELRDIQKPDIPTEELESGFKPEYRLPRTQI
jgi:hypothetical protein